MQVIDDEDYPPLQLPPCSGLERIEKHGRAFHFMAKERKEKGIMLLLFAAVILVPGVIAFFEPKAGNNSHLAIFISAFVIIILPLTLGGLVFLFSQPCLAILDKESCSLHKIGWFTGKVQQSKQTKTLYLMVNTIHAGEDSTVDGVYIGAADTEQDPSFEVELWSQTTGGQEHIDLCIAELKKHAEWKGIRGDNYLLPDYAKSE